MNKKTISYIFVALFMIAGCSKGKIEKYGHINSPKLKKIIEKNADNPDFIIIDVRRPNEFALGHLKNAINIDYYESNFRDELDKLDREKTYAIYCRTGSRSGSSLGIMKILGFTKVYNLSMGIVEWEDYKYPVVK